MKPILSLAAFVLRRSLPLLAVVAALLILPCQLAVAADYAKVPDRDPTTIAANPFIAGAYGFIWVALLVYVVFVARGLQKASSEVKSLQRKLDQQA
ncbi:MAG: CcmD family protein [Deltaproteobacteria bacterium]|nr:CcmD family protein [Deltaproteobacteria bacterium]